MTAAVANEWEITYGGFVVGGTSDYLLKGPVKLSFLGTTDRTQRRIALEATVVHASPVEATFVAALVALKAAFSTQRQVLTVKLGSTNVVAAVGYNAVANATEAGAELSTGRSREVSIRVEAEIATTFANGLAWASFEVAADPAGRRTVTISGTYNEVSPNSALAQYYAESYAFSSSYLAALPDSPLTDDPPEWHLVRETPKHDTANKVCEWTQVYEEVVYPETNAPSPGPLADDDLVQVKLDVQVRRVAEGDAGPQPFFQPGRQTPELPTYLVNKPAEVTAVYEGWVRTGNIRQKWESKIRPWLLATVRDYSQGQLAVVEVSPVFGLRDNVVRATVRGIDYRGLLASLELSVDETRDFGAEVDPLATGVPTDAVVGQVAAVVLRTVTRRSKTIGPLKLLPGVSIPTPPSAGWVSQRLRMSSRQITEGLFPDQVSLCVTDAVEVLRFVTSPAGASGSNRTPTPGGSGSGPGIAGPDATSTSGATVEGGASVTGAGLPDPTTPPGSGS